MSASKLLRCLVALMAALPLCGLADSFDVKTGAWENTVTTTTSGMTIPPDMLSKLPPERRAKIEEAMRARAGQPRSMTDKHCVTQKDLDEDRLFENDRDSQCTRRVLSKSGRRIEGEQTCGAAPHTMVMHVVVEATSSTSVIMTADGQMPGGGKSHIEARGRWLGASCAGIKQGN